MSMNTTTAATFVRQPSTPAALAAAASAVAISDGSQVHSFVKDKLAWEHAISMYQGRDPLDHWYNYICWYENHVQSDPEQKFRETLERCLTIYEHNEFYKQDARMVRLWLKYIAMQPNPLHFYEVLYQRGTGRQVAAFYIGWATYYESIQGYKQAESVYSLAFREKAQTYTELHHAHSKFMYARTLTNQQQQAQLQHTSQQAIQSQQQQVQAKLQSQSSVQKQQHEQAQVQFQQQQKPHIQNCSQHKYRTYPSQHHQQHQMPHHQQQTASLSSSTTPATVATPAAHNVTQYQQQQQKMQLAAAFNTQNENHTTTQPVVVATHLKQQHQLQSQFHQPQHQSHTLPLHNQQVATSPVQPHGLQLPAAKPSMHSTAKQNGDGQSEGKHLAGPKPLGSCRLPRNFASYARNNNETWKPALTLEEPEDPHRRCHYPKNLVYPLGAGIEYSPEEIHARKFVQILEQKRMQEKKQQQAEKSFESSQLSESYAQNQTLCTAAMSGLETNNNKHGSSSFATISTPATDEVDFDDDDEENDDDESDDAEDDEDIDEEEDNDGGEIDDADYNSGTRSPEQQQQPQHQQQQMLTKTINNYDDDQIEASTIRFSMQTAEQGIQNKTIKIKFKKDPQSAAASQNGIGSGLSAYSAYTIESISQQDIAPVSPQSTEFSRHRNGHSFHPYMLGQTSTPKTPSSSGGGYATNGYNAAGSKRHSKSKLKRIQSKFQAAVCSSSNSSSATQEQHLQGEQAATASVATCAINASAIQNATFNDNANHSFSSAAAFDISNCSITSAVGRLNFRDTSAVGSNLNLKHAATANNNNNSTTTTLADYSTFQENSYFATQHDTEAKQERHAKALETIERHLAKEAIDPFNSELCRAFLTKLNFPVADDEAHANYKIIQTQLPKIANTRTLSLPDGVQFNIDKEVGRGSYGSVYKATDVRTSNVVALKYQKPPNTWEIYICDQVLKRVTEPTVLPGLMDISTAIIAPNASLIATEFSPFGSLLDINNKIRQATTKVMHESLVMHFSSQICNIIHHLHRHRIIHADIKPDNFLLMRVPSTELDVPSLRLIDFGCAIDMTLFPDPEHTKFRKVIQTDGFTCIEMQEGRPWSYETDLFCIAGTVHVMLFGEYMQLQHRTGSWDIRQKLPRYLKKHVWSKFFGDILNIQDGKLPDLLEMRETFDEEAYRMDNELQKQIRSLSNILRRR